MQHLNQLYRYASSMKVGITLLCLSALLAAAGSVFYPDAFFQTVLFKLIFLLLFSNMVLCSFNQISKFVKLRSNGRRSKWFCLKRISLVTLHAGIVLIMVGGATNAYCSQSTQVTVTEGNTVDLSTIIPSQRALQLRLNQFEISFYANGSPSQYYSRVSITDDSRYADNYTISVNHPLNYAGIKIYQESFGYMVNVKVDSGTGGVPGKLLAEGQTINIPGTDRSIKAYKYIPDFVPDYGMNTRSLKPNNPKVVYSVYEKEALLGIGLASFGEKIEISKGVYVNFNGVTPFAVLRIKRDPGILIVATGGLMLIVGVCLSMLYPLQKKNKPQFAKKEDRIYGL